MNYFGVFIGAALINNYVLIKLIGITPFILSPKNLSSSFFMGLSITFVLFISNLIIYPIFKYILVPLNIEYLDLLIYTFFILIIIKIINILIKNYFPLIYHTIGIYFPIIIFNSVLFGVNYQITNNLYIFNFISSIIYSIGSGFGYLLSLILMGILRRTIPENDLPEYLQGTPIILICAGIISMLFQLISNIIII